jgi:hypothetical protein
MPISWMGGYGSVLPFRQINAAFGEVSGDAMARAHSAVPRERTVAGVSAAGYNSH